jgi:hypothetical protein
VYSRDRSEWNLSKVAWVFSTISESSPPWPKTRTDKRRSENTPDEPPQPLATEAEGLATRLNDPHSGARCW